MHSPVVDRFNAFDFIRETGKDVAIVTNHRVIAVWA